MFEINGIRGVCVRPRRGGISVRYLEILAGEHIGLAVIDGPDRLLPTVYDLTKMGMPPRRLRALPVSNPSVYPNADVIGAVVQLLREAARTASEAIELGSRLIDQKIDDERKGSARFNAALAFETQVDLLRGIVPEQFAARVGPALDRIQTAAALLAGYRLTPTCPAEVAGLLDLIGRLSDGVSVRGLPASLAFAFSGGWVGAKSLAVAAHAIGSQLLGLPKADESVALLPTISGSAIQFLQKLFPASSFVPADFLDWVSEKPLDRLIVVPPLGCRVTEQRQLERSQFSQKDGKQSIALGAEVLFVEHALRNAAENAVILAVVSEGLLASVGNSDFREWLLRQAQLLAVISLPAGSCYQGTSVRCSLLYMRKRASQPDDYSIFFAEVQEEDLLDATQIGALQTAIDKAIEETQQQCA